MFQRVASALFGDDVQELNRCSRPVVDKEEEEEDEDWILVNYLAEACSSHCGDGFPGSRVSPGEEDGEEEGEEEEDEDDLVMIPSPIASPAVRYASCTSLNSMADTDPEGGAEDDEDVDDEEEGGFLRLDAGSLEESWFVTPPPCFTGRSSQQVLLEASPLENLLIEHPSMSVYAHHSPPRLTLDPLPQRALDGELDFLSSNRPSDPTISGGKEKARCALDGARHRPDVAVVPRRSSLHSACYAAALSPNTGLLQPRPSIAAQRAQPLSRKALRRLNLLRPPKGGTIHLHQPSQRHLNF
ncbi:tumor protein p53-inducible nuclear protein 1 [Cololabis saira]|uniref:tumor protein p53-inducible nuclear protein 1 n=1 Tax=Cololabis saira TaxID=129043 RepID=UPI002AD21C39|nr:tumor protein p53-inducible nuclear protein 1 [Cololabis saira]